MLLVVYRSIRTTLIQLFLTFLALLTARGVVALLASHGAFGLTTFAGNILTMLAIAAATDYGIFIFGRYREDRGMGLDRDDSYYATFKSVAPVIVGSGLTIAGASIASASPACRTSQPWAPGGNRHAGRRGDLGHARPRGALPGQPSRTLRVETAAQSRFWRKVGTAVCAGPHRFSSPACSSCCSDWWRSRVQAGYNDRYYLPKDAPVNLGFAAADRHFTQARMNPDIMMIQADHDMRNPADMLVLNKVASNVMHTDGIAMVQSITGRWGFRSSTARSRSDQRRRPDHQHEPAVPTGSAGQPAQDRRRDEYLIDILEKHYQLSLKQTQLTEDSAAKSADLLETTKELRTTSPTSTTSSGRCAITSSGNRTALTSRSVRQRNPCSIPWTASTRSPTRPRRCRANTDQLASLAPQLTALLPRRSRR